MSEKFPKSHRLCTATEFKHVWDKAKRLSDQYLILVNCKNDLGYPRLGLSLAKKNIRLAKNRNRLKRVARETFRTRQAALGGVDLIVIVKKGADSLTCTQQHEYFNALWNRFTALLNKQQSKHWLFFCRFMPT